MGQTARQNAIAGNSSQNAFVAGSTVQVSFFAMNPRTSGGKKRSRRKKMSSAQVSFFKTGQAQARERRAKPLPTQRQIKISNDFTPEELQTLSVQLRLGAAAVTRHLRELQAGAPRDIGHGDPRPADWARLDQQNFQFLVDQLSRARRENGYIDTSALKKEALFDLWEFAQFEADRAQRNIDHLTAGSHLKGPTAAYLTGQHQLKARFYTFLAGQLEPMITPEMVAAEGY